MLNREQNHARMKQLLRFYIFQVWKDKFYKFNKIWNVINEVVVEGLIKIATDIFVG